MRGVFQAEQAPEDGRELRAVWRSSPEQFLGPVVVLATVQAAEADAAYSVGCCDPGKNGYASGDVEVLAPAALPEH